MRMQRLSLSILLLIALAPVAYATGQAADRLIYNGKTYQLFSNPLEDYYSQNRRRPPFMIRPHTTNTGVWRGYVATWEIIDGRLYLNKVNSWLCGRYAKSPPNKGCRRVTLRELFGKKVVNGRVLASWVSDRLRVPDGKELQYVHMGYGSIYERDILFDVEAGRVIKQEIIDNTNRKRASSEELQKPDMEKPKTSPLEAEEHTEVGDKPVHMRLGQEFKLRAGQRTAVEGLSLKFVSVANDSRCPADVNCVWAGNAEVQIEAGSGGSRQILRLNTHGGEGYPKEARHKQYIIALVSLSPYPRTDRQTEAADYVATLVIRKQ